LIIRQRKKGEISKNQHLFLALP